MNIVYNFVFNIVTNQQHFLRNLAVFQLLVDGRYMYLILSIISFSKNHLYFMVTFLSSLLFYCYEYIKKHFFTFYLF